MRWRGPAACSQGAACSSVELVISDAHEEHQGRGFKGTDRRVTTLSRALHPQRARLCRQAARGLGFLSPLRLLKTTAERLNSNGVKFVRNWRNKVMEQVTNHGRQSTETIPI